MGITKRRWPLLKITLIAGFIAISVNTLLLKLAPVIHLRAEGGGLLKLLLQYGRPITGRIDFLYTPFFGLIFHYLTGLVMAMIYGYWFSRLLNMSGWIKGSLFSLLPWLINGLIVLPLLGFGMLGSYKLSLAGMAYFFISNWLFGLVLGWTLQNFTHHQFIDHGSYNVQVVKVRVDKFINEVGFKNKN